MRMEFLLWSVSFSFLLAFMSVLGDFTDLSSVKCYMCNSKSDPRCKDPFDPAAASSLELVDCTMDSQQRQSTRKAIEEVLSLMTKLGQAPVPQESEAAIPLNLNDSIPMACQKMELEVMGDRVIGRGCSSQPLGIYQPCDALKLITSKDITLHYCALCLEDGCNNSWKTPISLWTIVTSAAFLLYGVL